MKNLPKVFIIILVLSIFIFFIYLLINRYSFVSAPSKSPESLVNIQTTSSVIAIVGDEKIYQEDLEEIYKNYSGNTTESLSESKTILLDKLIEGSILLQENKSKISLTPDIYNSLSKDTLSRLMLVDKLRREKTEELKNAYAGKEYTLVSIWPMNMEVLSLGYDQSKEIATQKITDLHNRVVSGQISIDQAGELVKSDTSLALIDKNYIGNAMVKGKITSNKPLDTTSAEMRDDFNKMKVGDISKIYIIKQTEVEEYLTFGQITNEIPEGNSQTYEQWLTEKKEQYLIELL